MANKDGIVSIGFDYKKELDEVCATIEKELNNLGGDINLSDGIKKQMAEVKKMIADMKKDIGSSFDKITETKLDTKTFESFKKDVNKRIREINKEVTTLKEQFSTLDGSANVNGIVQQFANLKKHVEDSNASISEFINNSEKLGKSVIISPNLDTDSFKNEIAEIKSLLTKLGKEDFDFGYSNKSAKELGEIARELVFDYRDLSEEIEETKSKLNSMNNSDKGFKEQEAHLSKLSLELIECGRKIDDVFGSENSQKVDWEKYLNINEIDEISKYVAKKTEEIRANAQQIINSIATSNNISSTNKNNGLDNTNRSNNIEVHISTKQSTINKQLDEMIDNLQQRAANKPIIAPVKLRVDSEYEKTTKDASASALTENQINEARKDVESVVPGLEKAFNNSMRIATNKAVENAKESIKAVREFFETNPITVHLTIPEDERLKIGKSILSEDGKTTVDISGQVDKARKSVKGLSEDLEKSQLLIKENAQNAKNLSLEKLVNSLSETMTQFSELKGIISSIQNMENTIARASGISSTNELVEQWSVVEKTIINATKLDGDFRKNANIGKIVSEYQKYIDIGGTNALSSIDKIKDNETTINSILSKMKELKSQDIENDSIQKLSVDLDGVIAKFDELISTVKTATNALYKIIKQGSVSDLDKQWSSISNKFKSIADESGKINLSKQKTDIKELMDMYQRYENAGGTNSFMSLTDNVETLRKLDKEYQKLNKTQSVDNSSTIEKESESFKSVEKSVDSLTNAIGDTKVQAINVEATAMEDAAEREIMAIRSILDNLDLVVGRLKDIKGIKLPKMEVKNVDVVEKAVESLENTGNKSNISSGTQIEDVFQGDKIEQATTSAKELDKTLEKVDIPTDSFDDVLSKLDLTESKLKEIVKITKQSVSDSEGKFHDSYTLKDKRGSTEIYGLSSNTEKGQLLRSNIVGYDAKEIEKANKQILKSEQELQAQKNAFHKKNISAIDLEIQKREEESKMISSALKTQMEERQKQLSSMESSLKSYQDKAFDLSIKPDEANRFPEYQAQLDSINKAINDYSIHINSLQNKGVIDPSDIDEANRLKSIIEELLKNTKKFSSGDKGFTNIGADKVLEKINTILEQNSRMSKTAKDQIKAYYNEIYSGNPTRPLNEILDSVYKIVQQEREAGRAGKSWIEVFKDKKIYSFLGQAASMFSFYDLIRYGREGIDTIREFDDGLTKISYTMDMTKSQLNGLGKSVLEMANDLDSSINNAMQVSQIYANMNTSAEEIKKLSEPTLILSNLTGFDASTVADDIQAVTQQFDIAAESSMHIADVYDQISRNISVDYSKGIESIAEAVQVAGSTADQAGLSFEQLAAIVGKTVEKTRLEGSQVGNGLKTIMTRLSKVGKLSEEVNNETLSQASESLKKVGIEVYNLDGSYREFDVIMGELAGKWDSLTDAEKSNISFNIAATRQTNLLSAVLSNFSDSMQLAEEATNANGNALENNQKWVDSFGGHLQSLENTAKSAWINILDSETIKGGVDVLNSLLKVVVGLVDTFGLLPTAAAIGGGILGGKNLGKVYKRTFSYCFEYALYA